MMFMMWRRSVIAALLCILVMGCAPKREGPEKILENGVEVVINHLEPYRIKGEPFDLVLKEKARIDFGSEDFEKFGFKRLNFVEADSDGNIYVAEEYDPVDYFIYKFDKNGKYITRFGRPGQGPGEIQRVYGIYIDSYDRIRISDIGRSKIIEFDKSGKFVQEIPVPLGLPGVAPLENGDFVVRRSSAKGYELSVLSRNLKMRIIDSFDLSELRSGKKTAGFISLFYWRATTDRIYVGNEQRGYEIWMFDLDGNLLKKIRKEFQIADYPQEFKEQTRKLIERDPRFVISEHTPPFNSFFIDDAHRLFVMTYEKGEGEGEYIHDIFNSEGIFIGRKSMKLFGILGRALNPRWAVAKNGCYYCLRYPEKSDSPELIVYKMIWK